jgi:NhaP-type Na+/H+ or K+/H+ antiporter
MEDYIMLTSLALIFLLGLMLGSIFNKLKLPGLLGMLITGMILSPYAFDLLDSSILNISADLRKLALVIILTRAGLSLNIDDLKRVGRPAILMCFLPACFEILGIIVIAPKLLGITLLEAAIMGSVVAAVSPAIIVPRMIRLIDEGYGTKKSLPQLILAGASVDDVFVIVLFTVFTSLAVGGSVSVGDFTRIPISIIVGLITGILLGLILTKVFKIIHMRDSAKVIVLLSVSFLLIELENQLAGIIPMSGLLAIMSLGATLYQTHSILAKRLSFKFTKLWVAAEILLFVLVGATVDLNYAVSAGLIAIVVVVGALLFRMVGVLVCLINTKFTKGEKVFCMISYTPKATVQAAIGGIPLSLGLACGQKVLTIAVLSILITAPLGAIFMDRKYKKLLDKE